MVGAIYTRGMERPDIFSDELEAAATAAVGEAIKRTLQAVTFSVEQYGREF